MAQGPIAIASTSSSSTSHGVTVKDPPPRNGITSFSMVMPDLQNCFNNQESSSENTRGETSTTHSIRDHSVHEKKLNKLSVETKQNEVVDGVITNENPAIGEPVDNITEPSGAPINAEIETIQEVRLVTASIVLTTTTPIQEPSGSIIKIEIARSIVYGGLTELIASLGIVTSTATTKATTGKIVALSLVSLIAGLFVMIYRISELWMKNHESRQDEPEDREAEKYEDVFGDRKHYGLHFTVAILSFVLFGLVPPLVYGFTFRKPEDKILKIPTVTIVTVFCTGLLGVGKAYIQKATNCVEYVNIIGKCIVDAIGTSVLTTLGGDLIEKYFEQTGWFEPNKIPTFLFQPSMSFENGTWAAF